MPTSIEADRPALNALPERILAWAQDLGFSDAAVSRVQLQEDEHHLRHWLEQGYHGSMGYMSRNPAQRSRPAELREGTVSVISARMDYWPVGADAQSVLDDPRKGYIARYTLGRDYHRTVRGRLLKLAARIGEEIEPHGYRVFSDSAPSLEKALARDAGLGWIGKNTLLLNRKAGSYFLLGEIYTDLPLAASGAARRRPSGSGQSCIDIFPTRAIVAPYQLDARRCISYLTIEHRGSIPLEFREAIGNRIFGCDDCQIVCPWNRYARPAEVPDFNVRHGFDAPSLVELFSWEEDEYLRRTEGMALRRGGYGNWLRNLAVALGNAPHEPGIIEALRTRADDANAIVREHVHWALQRHGRAA
ncbi:MAG: tRNA epoxyqueuosine(34) reductase QueG [Pseudomonadota bacterium]|nr:tRNA epoxyqueuosine(34) reductase QueG [Pseudomonadota bacterium]